MKSWQNGGDFVLHNMIPQLPGSVLLSWYLSLCVFYRTSGYEVIIKKIKVDVYLVVVYTYLRFCMIIVNNDIELLSFIYKHSLRRLGLRYLNDVIQHIVISDLFVSVN